MSNTHPTLATSSQSVSWDDADGGWAAANGLAASVFWTTPGDRNSVVGDARVRGRQVLLVDTCQVAVPPRTSVEPCNPEVRRPE